MLELHAIASKKDEEKCGRFAIAMTQSEQMKFLKDLSMSPNVKQYYDMLGITTSTPALTSFPFLFVALFSIHVVRGFVFNALAFRYRES